MAAVTSCHRNVTFMTMWVTTMWVIVPEFTVYDRNFTITAVIVPEFTGI